MNINAATKEKILGIRNRSIQIENFCANRIMEKSNCSEEKEFLIEIRECFGFKLEDLVNTTIRMAREFEYSVYHVNSEKGGYYIFFQKATVIEDTLYADGVARLKARREVEN